MQTWHPKVCCVIGPKAVLEEIEDQFDRLHTLPGEPPDVIRESLQRIVPEYRPAMPPRGTVGAVPGDRFSAAITERPARGG